MVIISNLSYVTFGLNNIFHNDHFTVWTSLSQNSPQNGAASTINCHLIPRINNFSLSFSSSLRKLVPLSEINNFGISRQGIKRFKPWMKDVDKRSGTKSRWTALVAPHVYQTIFALNKGGSSYSL